jgi:hypothetical protein
LTQFSLVLLFVAAAVLDLVELSTFLLATLINPVNALPSSVGITLALLTPSMGQRWLQLPYRVAGSAHLRLWSCRLCVYAIHKHSSAIFSCGEPSKHRQRDPSRQIEVLRMSGAGIVESPISQPSRCLRLQ